MPNVTTSIPIEVYNMAKEKQLKWSDALRIGILTMLNTKLPASKGESYEEPDTPEEIIRRKNKHIELLNKKIQNLENGN